MLELLGLVAALVVAVAAARRQMRGALGSTRSGGTPPATAETKTAPRASEAAASRPEEAGRVPGPSWMPEDEWTRRLVAYERQGRGRREVTDIAEYLEARGPRSKRSQEQVVDRFEQTGTVSREMFVGAELEAEYLQRAADGWLTLRLIDVGDRLAPWAPLNGGAFLNPKGVGLRRVGLCVSYARGTDHYRSAYRVADVSKGAWVDLRREPDNPHDKNAVAMHAPGAKTPFGHVQRGRAAAVARRMDAGEDMAALSLRGAGRGRDDDSALLIIGSREDLRNVISGRAAAIDDD